MSQIPSRTRLRTACAAMAFVAVAAVGNAALSQPVAAADGAPQNYIVLAPQGAGVAKATARVRSTGGTVVARYAAIGVLVARAARADFATAAVGPGVQSAAATAGLGTAVETAEEATVADADPPTTGEALWSGQWDMRAIQVA